MTLEGHQTPVARILWIGVVSLAVVSCDRGSRVRFQGDVGRRFDSECVESALTSVYPAATRTSYVSEGSDGFPAGTEVVQFTYQDENKNGGYALGFGQLSNGTVHGYNEWSKLGRISNSEAARAEDVIRRANSVIESRCKLPTNSFTEQFEG